jgi:hypothetical protein
MLQRTQQNDTILKQLDQAVGANTINTVRTLIEQQPIETVDSTTVEIPGISAPSNTRVNQNSQSVSSKLPRNNSRKLDSVQPIQSGQVKVFTEKDSKPGIVLPEKSFERERPDWLIGIFILIFVLLATVRLFFNKYLNQLFHSIINYPTSARLFRERTLSLTHASFRLDLIFYFTFGVFVYQFFDLFHVSFNQSSIVTYLIILGLVIGYYILKRVAYSFAGIVAGSTAETAEFLYNMHLHNRILGLFLIPVTLVIAFGALQNPRLMVYAGLFVVAFFYLLLIIRGAKILMTKHFSIFYLILYLCTLEILPLIFIYNMVLVKNGIK